MEELLEELDRLREVNTLIIVEGKKDTAALNKFNITNITELSKKPIFAVVEEVVKKTKRCAILTDLDVEGKKLYRELNSALNHHGITIDNRFRNYLFKNTKLTQIEGLVKHIEK